MISIFLFYKYILRQGIFVAKRNNIEKSQNVLVRYKVKQFIKIIENTEPIKESNVNLF